MYLLYSVLLTLGLAVLLPRFLYDALRYGKYVAGGRERLGGLKLPAEIEHRVIWLHCVSVGETQAARPLARALLQAFPSHSLVVSTTTLTGQRVAREVFGGEAAAVFYFPFDWSWTVRRALKRINPRTVLIMETELWPNFLRECRRRGITTALVNGRLSATSFRRYKLARRFISRVVKDLDLALMQTEADAERIRALGLASARVKVSGNIKFDLSVAPEDATLTEALAERFRFGSGVRPLIVAASTHSPEERIIIEAFKRLRSGTELNSLRLLLAPRHPERFVEVASLVESSGLGWARRTVSPAASDADSDVILLDTIGELRAVYQLATIVFVGGSLTPVGGHNVLEPAAVGACIVTGAHTTNFAEIIRVFLKADALVQLPDVPERDAARVLAAVLEKLLTGEARRLALSVRARAVLEQNRGATGRTIELLAPLLTQDK
jgi:3-deoxy-D-manno-octulosonic-acid transferase